MKHMGVAVPRALVGGWGPEPPQKFGITGPSLLVNCYIRNNYHKNFRLAPIIISINWDFEITLISRAYRSYFILLFGVLSYFCPTLWGLSHFSYFLAFFLLSMGFNFHTHSNL